MKPIAFYLPQFHEIEENNRAWGKGFTEWDNVKKARPLFEGHNQPRVPLNDNYYNLLNPDTMEWQIKLAKEYGIYGFCFYHYWFRDGKMALEKPAELWLENSQWNFPLCFAWANEPWTKTWHGAAGEKEVLLEQRYGKEEQWKKHFEYLLPFFKDSRYIKEQGKPVFLIYQINKIGCFNKMIDCWNELARQNGIPELYIVDMLTADGKISRNKRVSASVDFEPGKETRKKEEGKEEELLIQNYDVTCTKMLKRTHRKNEFRCMFVDYDDTPRRGEKGNLFMGSTPEKFGAYLQKTVELSKLEKNDYIFINAWNEWGEGNYLEPDTNNGFAYLEALEKALAGKQCTTVWDNEEERIVTKSEKIDKYRQYYELCNSWVKLNNNHYQLETYFFEHNYKTIAIYGMGELGNRLVEALEESDITIKYGIDSNVWAAFAEIDIKGIDDIDFIDDVECVVVTPVHVYDKIYESLKDKAKCDIISLEDVIYGM